MGWENRNGKTYYYRKEWERGRCVSAYIGAGDLARFTETIETSRRKERELIREAWRLERGQMQRNDESAAEIFAAADDVMETALLAAGCYKHNREWRRGKRCPNAKN